jgi:hypothetical protein
MHLSLSFHIKRYPRMIFICQHSEENDCIFAYPENLIRFYRLREWCTFFIYTAFPQWSILNHAASKMRVWCIPHLHPKDIHPKNIWTIFWNIVNMKLSNHTKIKQTCISLLFIWTGIKLSNQYIFSNQGFICEVTDPINPLTSTLFLSYPNMVWVTLTKPQQLAFHIWRWCILIK